MTIRDALKEYNYEVIKYMIIQNHYGTDLDISKSSFDLAEKHLYYFYNTIIKAQKFINDNNKDNDYPCINNLQIKEKFTEAMDDDFGTPLATSYLYTIFKYINSLLESPKGDKLKIACEIESILEDVKDTYKILGLFEQEPEKYIEEVRSKHLKNMNLSPDDIKEKIKQRQEAKKNKDYSLADKIRDSLKSEGIDLRDTKDGTTWDLSL